MPGWDLRDMLAKDFLGSRPGVSPLSHQDAYLRAVKMMRSPAAKAFELDDEPAEVRDAYGRNPFGQGCLLARRLVEKGVPFVEVTLSAADGSMAFGWDTHQKNFDAVQKLSQVLDPAWATLMTDLRTRGLLDSTLIVWMGEFGRTPKINKDAGRDHFPNAWTTVLAGGGIKGGQAIGDTGPDGMTVKDRPVTVPDLLATVCKALGDRPGHAKRLRRRTSYPDCRPQIQGPLGGGRMRLLAQNGHASSSPRASASLPPMAPRRPAPTRSRTSSLPATTGRSSSGSG